MNKSELKAIEDYKTLESNIEKVKDIKDAFKYLTKERKAVIFREISYKGSVSKLIEDLKYFAKLLDTDGGSLGVPGKLLFPYLEHLERKTKAGTFTIQKR